MPCPYQGSEPPQSAPTSGRKTKKGRTAHRLGGADRYARGAHHCDIFTTLVDKKCARTAQGSKDWAPPDRG